MEHINCTLYTSSFKTQILAKSISNTCPNLFSCIDNEVVMEKLVLYITASTPIERLRLAGTVRGFIVRSMQQYSSYLLSYSHLHSIYKSGCVPGPMSRQGGTTQGHRLS